MTETGYGEDPEPSDRFPAGPLYVPVRPGPSGCVTRVFRTPLGDRTAVGFTSARRLTATLGAGQAWIRLAEPALRALNEPLGVTTVTVDPQFTAPASAPAPAPAPVSTPRSARPANPAVPFIPVVPVVPVVLALRVG
ncbi:SAV_915 family protein [Streptomyces sp. NPDC092369]|uniref:SAV_915 family protein n=1 Tax=Streptomyces sp. NPDC092369 TaxID=3366015 RepID=UPI0038291A48